MRSAAQQLQNSAKRAAKKKEDAEWKALQELQNNHGYFLGTTEMVKKGHNPYVSTFKVDRVSGKMSHHMKYMVTFSVPLDSVLGKGMTEAAKTAKAKKARKTRAATRRR